jgi:5'-AMP-activated protein kinase regulatory beta subunit
METLVKAQHGHRQSSDAVDFFCHAPEAHSVFVAGTFNQWRPDATPMLEGEDGEWKTSLPLIPGHYEYKFVVDGQWCCEPGCEHEYRGCPKCVPNEFHTMNRVLEVA